LSNRTCIKVLFYQETRNGTTNEPLVAISVLAEEPLVPNAVIFCGASDCRAFIHRHVYTLAYWVCILF